MKLDFYQVDAFTDQIFGGNPAAVCPLDQWIDPSIMQRIAEENNLAETAFFVKKDKGEYEIRWFMPHDEIDLCGHATLASAHVIFSFLDADLQEISFESKSGPLRVHRTKEDLITLDFPSRPPEKREMPEEVQAAFNHQPLDAWAHRDLILVFKDEEAIRSLTYDLTPLKSLPYLCIIATAKGKQADFVSRVFDANASMPEDPVTGSAHCSLIPYWSNQLGKTELFALQLSERIGQLFCQDRGDRVWISGKAKTYAQGHLWTE